MPANSEKHSPVVLPRRSFLTSLVGTALTLAAPDVLASSAIPARDRELSFYNIHTGEKLSATFWSHGNYLDDGIEQISWLFRDHRAGSAYPIDTKLLDLLHQLQSTVERQGEFHVISGYRSPATNDMLRKSGSGVAKKSYHMLGRAVDVRLSGFDTLKLYKAARLLRSGGAGYYASSNFVHLDTGRVRYW